MPNQQPIVSDVAGKREFACSAVALQAIIVNQEQNILLFSSPKKNPDRSWQVIGGALEAAETIVGGTLREIGEEGGLNLRVRPLGTVHVETFKYDDNLQYVIGIYYLFAYEGGKVEPGDDMRDSEFHWWSLAEMQAKAIKLRNPPDPNGQRLLVRAIELYSIWKDQNILLQHPY